VYKQDWTWCAIAYLHNPPILYAPNVSSGKRA